MKIWLSKNSEVPLHQQLTTQIVLGIVSADLAPGEQLPSSRDLARRFHLHPNTVRAAFRELVRNGWLEWRKGSGFYVRALQEDARMTPDLELDRMISALFRMAQQRGYALRDIQSRISRWFSLQPPDHILVIEPDEALREILLAEIRTVLDVPLKGASVQDASRTETVAGAFCVALYDSAPEVSCFYLHSRSIAATLGNEMRPSPQTLITVVSRWPSFLAWARTVLEAVSVPPEAIDLRDGRKKGWLRGLKSREFLITDILMAQELPKMEGIHVFRVLSDESLTELKRRWKAEKQPPGH